MLTFPTHLFNPLRIKMTPAGSTLEGGESLLGERDVIRTDGGGYWLVDMIGIELLGEDMLRAWRAWEDHLENGVTKVLVPVADIAQAPRPSTGGGKPARPSGLVAESADPYFPEARAFATPLIVATITEPALLRATQLTINVERGAQIRGGEVFGINHPSAGRRCYRVRRVLARDGQAATVSIRTPLREAVADNTPVDFDWAALVATVVPNSQTSPEIGADRHAPVSITFREA